MVSAAAWEQEAWRLFRPGGTKQRAQGQKAIEDAPGVFVDRHPAFGVQLAHRNMKGPLIMMDLPQAIHLKIDTLADADSGEVDEQQSVGFEVVGMAELLLQALIVFGRKRLGQIAGARRKILAANQVGLERMTVVGQVPEQTAKPDQMIQAGLIAQGTSLIAKRAEPTQQMRIAAQLREYLYFGESRVEIAEEMSDYLSIVAHGVGAESSGQDVKVSVKDLLQAEGRSAHGIFGDDKRTR
jgi:hypothetical protein